MSIFKSAVALCICISMSLTALCQKSKSEENDEDDDKDSTTQIVQLNPPTGHKRGVYKTYEEYLSNTPSVEAEFTLQPVQISKKNPLIAEALVDWKSKRPKKIWAVSDGEYVYVRAIQGSFLTNHYFRLQCDGPLPYAFVPDNSVLVMPGLGALGMLTVAATTAALPPMVSLMMVKQSSGHVKPMVFATHARIKKYFAEFPDLLENYLDEKKHNRAIRVKYLTEYNKRKLNK